MTEELERASPRDEKQPDHPKEIWMWGREEAVGTSLYWLVHHKVLRNDKWIDDIPYSCRPEKWARECAAGMKCQKSWKGDHLYQEVRITGPHVEWREVGWKYSDEWKKARESDTRGEAK